MVYDAITVMKSLVRSFRDQLKRTPFYAQWKELGWYPDYFYWVLRGKPQRSPHVIKQKTVLEYAQRFQVKTLIETGTYYGEMVSAMRDRFDKIYSVEFVPELAERAKKRFAMDPHIQILQGDSKTVLPEILRNINSSTLFWLDAGYYGWAELATDKSRLTAELEAILRHPVAGHVILMDDARGLDGLNGSLSIQDVKDYILREFPGRSVAVEYDIIRITPSTLPSTNL